MLGKPDKRRRARKGSANLFSSASIELELKFQVRPRDLVAIRANSIFAQRPAATLRSVYFDTADRDLHKRGFSLRVREQDGEFIQTVKRSRGLGLFDRDQWECKIEGEKPDPLAWAGTAVASILKGKRGNSLVQIFATTVARSVGVIDEGGNFVEVSLDEGAISVNDLSEPVIELELELKGGDRSALFAIARRLVADVSLILSFESKAGRGFRLAGQNPLAARKACAAEILSGTSAAEAFPLIVLTCFDQIAGNAELLRRVRDSEVLHQLRVGLRRLRTALTTFRPILPLNGFDRLKAEAKWLGGELDVARNLDVLIKNTIHFGEAIVPADADLEALSTQLSAARAAAYKRVFRAIASRRFANFLLDCAEWVELDGNQQNDVRAVRRARDDDVRVFARRALDQLSRRVRKKGKHLRTLEPTPRHELRIEAKKLRYAAEFFADSFGHRASKRRKKFMVKLETLLDTLGQLNDVSTAERTLTAGIGGQIEMTTGAGQLVRAQTRGEPQMVIDADEAYAKWRRAKPFWRNKLN